MMRLRRLPLLLLPLLVLACSDSTAPEDEEFGGQQLQLSVVGPQAVSQAEIDALGAAFDRVDEYRVIIADAGTEEVFVDTSIPIPANSPQHNLDIDVPDEALGRTVTITLIAFDEGMELYRSVQTATLNEGVNAPIDVDAEIRYTGPGIRGVISGDEGALEAGVTVNLMIDQSIVDAVQTEDDGTYLFLDVDQGAYTVQPTPPLGEVICPGAKDVTISTGDEAIEANFRTDDECFVHMLVLSGGDFDDTPAVEAMLELDSGINALTFFHVNTLPGVDFLTNFDVVLVMMNGLFDESAALGDQLAEYVNRGGSLVTASFYYQGHSGSNLGSAGWGALEQLDPLSPLVDPTTGDGGATYQPVSLHPTFDNTHPIMEFVSSLSSTSFSSGVQANAGTEVLAWWDDGGQGAQGSPLVGVKTLPGGQRLVGVSLFPVPDPSITGSVDLLWRNVVRWAGFAPSID